MVSSHGNASATSPRAVLDAGLRSERALTRIERLGVGLPPVTTLVVLSALGAVDRWSGALLIVTALAAILLALRVESATEAAIAARLDRALAGNDAFLTLATVPQDARHALWSVVEARAGELAADLNVRHLRRPPRWQPAAASLLASLAVALTALISKAPEELERPVSTLGEIADAIAERSTGSELAAAVRRLDELVANPETPPAELQRAAEAVEREIEKLESRESGGSDSEAGGGEPEQGSGGGGSSGDALGDLRGELENISEQLEGESEGSDRSDGSDEGGGGDAGGSEAEGGEQKGEEGQGRADEKESTGSGAGKEPERGNQPSEPGDSNASGGAKREPGEPPAPGEGSAEAPNADVGGDLGRGAGERPRPSTDPSEEGDDGPGEGGGTLSGGGYIRVRVPEHRSSRDVEVVSRPGDARAETPFRNAPLPDEGRAGPADSGQRVPPVYDSILGGGG